MPGPLQGIRVLDFGTLLPVPMASLFLGEAGADIIKIERPTGDPARGEPAAFALLNRGKRSIAIDLKQPGSRDRLLPLIRGADVLLEQFRPGVMARLGLGYEDLRAENSRLIYCSVTGYGATGPMAQVPGHDLTYAAQTGMLSLSAGADGAPVMPAALVADIGGGTYPAVLNVLLALIRRNATGQGCAIDIAMHDNLFPFLYWVQARGEEANWPGPGDDPATGGSPRYNIYQTADGRFLSVAAAEPQFWAVFCETIGLASALTDPSSDPVRTAQAVAAILKTRSAAQWEAAFAGKDTIVSVVRSAAEGFASPQAHSRELWAHRVTFGGREIPALPTPIDKQFRTAPDVRNAPALEQDTGELRW